MKKYIITGFRLMIVLLLLPLAMKAQTSPLHQYSDNVNAWLMYFGDHTVSDKWGVHIEAQWRRNDVLEYWQQLLLRTGINYHINPSVFATVGYGYVNTYPYGDFPVKSTFPEHRIWEQLQIKTPLNRIEWVSRFRLEQRFLHLPYLNTSTNTYEPNNDATYSNRFRLLNRFSLPFKGKTISDKSFYATVYDEILISFGKNVAANMFDQNRLYGAIGYKIPKIGKLEVGYLLQTILKSDGIKMERNHTLQVGLLSNIDFYKKKNN